MSPLPPPSPSTPAPSGSVPRWLLPRVQVRQQGQVIRVAQVVPARVAEIHTDTHGSGTTHGGRTTRRYESGLGSPSGIPLVRERLTIPAGPVGAEQVEQAIGAALAGFQPAAYRGAPARPSLAPLPHLIGAMAFLAFACAAVVMAMRMRMDLVGSAGPGQLIWILMAFPAVFALVGVSMAAVCARRAWVLRTPTSIAEDQWGLLRQVLTGVAGQEPGSSRPLDVELGRRRDLLTHPPSQYPQGGRIVRATTADGRMGPPWPDAQDVHRLVRAGRRRALATGLFLVVLLVPAALIAAGISAGTGFPLLPLACVVASLPLAIMLVLLKGADPVVVAYPRRLPGEPRPLRVGLEDVDAPSLPGWCAARRREDAWDAAAMICAILFGASVAGALVGSILTHQAMPPYPPDPASGGGSAIWLIIAVVALVVVTFSVRAVLRVRSDDVERRRRAGLA
ncbi:hypothetical protein NSA19_03115 [Actinomyces bowdenii]|uniref:hypothetical protein n=1 Tax=Actinomyces bowdenii TaxID=131109 RepID=UPI00214B80DA|nr:hypothetical protein [Actinomyces bowdenii]MCR2051860.1 hypothetical protein [Actinomyces bowdenii]